jgi:uncharacterized membrane protein YphA (DoxX/SURF4 family)
MVKLSNVGRIFYGIGMAGIGFQSIFYQDFSYMMIPPHAGMPGTAALAYVSGLLLMLAGACIVFTIKTKPVALVLGTVLLLVFCFYFVPYEFMDSSRYMHLGQWENADKEWALSSGALVVAGYFPASNENAFFRLLAKLVPFGTLFFGITMATFGMDHFLYGKEAADYVPSWIPNHIFWIYFAGVPLFCSGIAIIFKIKVRVIATLLGIMIFMWVLMLHIPYSIASPFAGMGGEVTSGFLALAFSGIAFVIAGAAKQ